MKATTHHRIALLTIGLLIGATVSALQAADKITVKSPDKKIVLTVETGERLSYDVVFRGKPAVEKSGLGIVIDGADLGDHAAFGGKAETVYGDECYQTRGVHAVAVNRYHAAVIPVTSGKTSWQLEVKVFDDGVAYRYKIPGTGKRHVDGETSEWTIPVGTELWHHAEENRSYEGRYYPDIVGQLPKGFRTMAPATMKFPTGGYGMMTEANLVNYSDMALQSVSGNRFRAFLHDNQSGWDADGEIVSAWRVTVLAKDLNTLVNSDIIKNLCPAPAPELVNAPWIRPGRSIWHWLTGGSPKLEEQKTWIDGTQKLGYEYYLVDDGWRDWDGGGDNAWQALAGVVQYAKGKGVDIWAWVDSKYVFKPEDRMEYFKHAKSIGIVGLKIDFPHPANVTWANWYENVLRDAASQQLMIDFHGAVKPTGRERTWPNELTREAIAGREQGKNPSIHDTTLPFLRYVQGHADYTPTLLIPKRLEGSSFAHELAMAVVFTSPYLCMGDHPNNYLASDAADVLKALRPTWDQTIVLPGSEIGELAAFARRSGKQWFIGAINNQTPRRTAVSLNFLEKGRKYKLVELADSPDRNDAFVRAEHTVDRTGTLTLPLRKDGGYVAWITPVD